MSCRILIVKTTKTNEHDHADSETEQRTAVNVCEQFMMREAKIVHYIHRIF